MDITNVKDTKATSKLLSLILRHAPETVGLTLDAQGWADIGSLLDQCAKHGKPITRALLDETVAGSDKQRFAVSQDGKRIRANQGHSVPVDLAYEPAAPPETLFHGTSAQALPAVETEGLKKMGRNHVHLSQDEPTARAAAARRGRAVLLSVAAAKMHADGHTFYRAANGVWLTDRVPAAYIARTEQERATTQRGQS